MAGRDRSASPPNKDRPENRRAFVAKIAALLQHDVRVSVVDIVTIRQFNLYADLMELIGRSDPILGAEPPALYALTVRGRKRGDKKPLLDTWFYPLTNKQSGKGNGWSRSSDVAAKETK